MQKSNKPKPQPSKTKTKNLSHQNQAWWTYLVIIVTYLFLLVQACLIFWAYISHHSVFLSHDDYKLGFELIGESSRSLLISVVIAQLFAVKYFKYKQFQYIATFTSAVLIFMFMALEFISLKPGLVWWKYFSEFAFVAGWIVIILIGSISIKNKLHQYLLLLIGSLLLMGGGLLEIVKEI